MNTEILSPELSGVPHTSKKLSLATQTQLDGVLSKITGLLTPESKQEIQERNEKMKKLLAQLQEEIEKRRDEIRYDYEIANYEKRLCQSDEVLEKVFQERVLGKKNNFFGKLFKKDNQIQKIYEEMIHIIPEIGKQGMIQKLKREYFEDLIFESMEDKKLEEGENMKLMHNYLGQKTTEELIGIMKTLPVGLKNLNLHSNDLGNKTGEELEKIMKTLPVGLKNLNLHRNDLGNKTGEELEKIMKALPVGLKSLNLILNNLGYNRSEELEKIMKALPVGLKSLNLGRNKLGNKTGEELEKMMRGLPPSLKSLYLSENHILKENQQQLQTQFPNIKIIF